LAIQGRSAQAHALCDLRLVWGFYRLIRKQSSERTSERSFFRE
jgi:hypothetical protein